LAHMTSHIHNMTF